MSRLYLLARDAALYGSALTINRIVAFALFPVVARQLSVSDYGLFDLVLVLGGVLSTAIVFGQDSAVARLFYDAGSDAERRQVISQSLAIQTALVLVLLPVVWWVTPWLASRLFDDPGQANLMIPLLVLLPSAVALNFSQNVLKWTLARRQFVLVSVGVALLQTGLMLIAIEVYDAGVEELLWCSTFATLVGAISGVASIRRWIARPAQLDWARRLLTYAAPYGVIGIAAVLVPMVERALTMKLVGVADLGLYAAGTKVAMVVAMVSAAFQAAWGPFALTIYREPDALSNFNVVLKGFAVVASALVLVLSGFAGPIVTLLASERYAGAAVVIFPVTMGLSIQATSWILEVGIGLSKRSTLSLYGYGASVAVTLAAIFAFAPQWGVAGVGLSVLLGHAAKAVVAAWVAQRAYPLEWAYGAVGSVGVWTIAVWIVGIWAGSEWGTKGTALAHLVGLVCLVVGSWMVVLTGAERQLIRAAVPLRTGGLIGRY